MQENKFSNKNPKSWYMTQKEHALHTSYTKRLVKTYQELVKKGYQYTTLMTDSHSIHVPSLLNCTVRFPTKSLIIDSSTDEELVQFMDAMIFLVDGKRKTQQALRFIYDACNSEEEVEYLLENNSGNPKLDDFRQQHAVKFAHLDSMRLFSMME